MGKFEGCQAPDVTTA